MENKLEVQCSVMMQLKIASCKERAMALIEKEPLLRVKSNQANASVGVKDVRKTLIAFLDTGADPNLSKKKTVCRKPGQDVTSK